MSFLGPVFFGGMEEINPFRGVNPTALLIGRAFYGLFKVVADLHIAAKSEGTNGSTSKETIGTRQERGDLDSSEVEQYLNLGAVGPYKYIIGNKRPFSQGKDGDKGYVEADHIPPLDSLRRAEQEPEFRTLWARNRPLYDMVISLRNDPRGRNLLTVQVSTHHHRDALSSGNSRASRAVRGVLARRIARGEVMVMLKQAMIIAHPYSSQQIRSNAAIMNRVPIRRILLSRDRTMNIYRRAFLEVIQYYFEKGIINQNEKLVLEEYVENDGYLDLDSSECQEILDTVRRSLE